MIGISQIEAALAVVLGNGTPAVRDTGYRIVGTATHAPTARGCPSHPSGSYSQSIPGGPAEKSARSAPANVLAQRALELYCIRADRRRERLELPPVNLAAQFYTVPQLRSE
jgi:hypothetical protein